MSLLNQYYNEIIARLNDVKDHDEDAIEQAAQLLFDCEKQGGTIYAFGTGHSHMMGQDLYARAGGYAKVVPIVEIELTLLTHPTKSTTIERIPEYADVLEHLYHVKADDVVIVSSNSGRNGLVVEYTKRLKEKGAKIIAVTSLAHSKNISSRHPSGKRLFEYADVILDNRGPLGDASIKHNELISTGPVSTIMSCFMLQAMMSTFIQKCIDDGMEEIPVFRSSNGDNADEFNKVLFDKYIINRKKD